MGRLRLLWIVLLHPGDDHDRTVIGQIKPFPARPLQVFGSSGTANARWSTAFHQKLCMTAVVLTG